MRAVNLLPVEPKRTRKAPSAVAQIALVAPFVVARRFKARAKLDEPVAT